MREPTGRRNYSVKKSKRISLDNEGSIRLERFVMYERTSFHPNAWAECERRSNPANGIQRAGNFCEDVARGKLLEPAEGAIVGRFRPFVEFCPRD